MDSRRSSAIVRYSLEDLFWCRIEGVCCTSDNESQAAGVLLEWQSSVQSQCHLDQLSSVSRPGVLAVTSSMSSTTAPVALTL